MMASGESSEKGTKRVIEEEEEEDEEWIGPMPAEAIKTKKKKGKWG